MMRRAELFGAMLVLVIAACDSDGGDDSAATGAVDTDGEVTPPMNDTFPGASCADTDPMDCMTTSTTGDDGSSMDECQSSEDCDGGFCAATPDGMPTEDDGRFSRGPLACEGACILPLDEGRWCSDDASCCDGATCTPRGYCVVEGEDTDGGSTGGGSTGGGSTGGGSTGGGSTGG